MQSSRSQPDGTTPGFRGSEHPMLYAALAFAIGIGIARFAWRPPIWWVTAATVCLLMALAMLRRNAIASLLLAAGALIPLGALALNYQQVSRPPSGDFFRFTERDVRVIAHVTRGSFGRESENGSLQVVDVETEQIDNTTIALGLRVSIFDAADKRSNRSLATASGLDFGDRIAFTAKLREPRNFGNPGAMDYRGYLEDRGILLLTSLKEENVEALPGRVGSPFQFRRTRVRQSLLQHMLALAVETPGRLSLSRSDIGLLAAMILGEQSLLERPVKREFQRTGAFHILVVSGMNVGIMAIVVFAIAKWLRASEYVATAAAIILTLSYAYVTDLGAPIMRAALMLSLYLAARLLYRDRFSLNAIGTAAMVLLLAQPSSLFDPSFQLTFLCVLALSGITQPLLERSSQRYGKALYGSDIIGYDVVLPPQQAQFRLELRMIAGRLSHLLGMSADGCGRWLARTLRAAIAAFNLVVVTAVLQVALALPMVYYFHRLTLLGLPTNILVIPFACLLLPVAITATLLTYISQTVATIPAVASAILLRWVTGVVSTAGGMSFAELRTPTPSSASMIAIALAFPAALYMMRKQRAIALTGLTLLATAALWLAFPPKAQQNPLVAEVTVLDVGQGDSILLVSPEGKTLLVDGGGPLGFVRNDVFEVGEDVVSPYLWSRGISRLDAVALSHAHSDHMGGLGSVIANFRPRELWTGAAADTLAYRDLLDLGRRHGTRPVTRSAGEQIAFGRLQIRVLAPATKFAQTRNDESLVLEVRYGDSSALLTGDAERLSEKAIASSLQHVDVLKIAHHGSATSTTPELMQAATPGFAAVSVGRKNVYGHPKPQVLQRLEAAGVRTFRTDMHGAVTFYLDGEKVITRTFMETR